MHRKTKSLLLFFLLASAAITRSPAIAQGSPDEQALLQQANQARAQHNLPALRWDNALAAAARNHLRWVLRNPDNLQHQYPGEPDLVRVVAAALGWERLGFGFASWEAVLIVALSTAGGWAAVPVGRLRRPGPPRP